MNLYSFDEENHIHKRCGKPLIGTTTSLEIIAKPLVWWASGMCAGVFGWLNSKKHDLNERLVAAGEMLTNIKLMTIKEYLDLLDKAYKAHNAKKEARAKEGTDLHALAEEYVRQKMAGIEPLFVHEKLKAFVSWCDVNVKRFLFCEIHCYSEKLWVGGKTDIGFEMFNGDYVLSDIKSRDQDYFTDHVQCGGYDIQITENGEGYDKDGNVIWKMDRPFNRHAIFTLGDKFKEPIFSKSVEANKQNFIHAVGLYKGKQEFEQ